MLNVRGHVKVTATDDLGQAVATVESENAWTDAYASFVAQLCGSGGTPSMPFTHISMGGGGFIVTACDSATGWSTAPTVDTTVYKQGTGSLKMTQTVSTSGTYSHATLISASDGTGGSIEAWLRVATRANTDLTASEFRIYTGGTTSNGYKITLAGIEALPTGAFSDGVWKLVTIPVASFTGFGAPSWASVRGAGFVLAANSSGTAIVNMDDIRWLPAAYPVGETATAVADERTKKALTSLVYTAPYTVTATAYWTAGDAAGAFHVAGLWGGTAGATLAAITAVDLSKLVGFNLTVQWTVTFDGG